MKLPPPQRRSSIQRRETYISINNTHVDHSEPIDALTTCNPRSPESSLTRCRNDDNSPQYLSRKARDEDAEPLNEYSTPSEDFFQQKGYDHRKRQLQSPIELQPHAKRYRRFLCLPQRSKPTIKRTQSASFVEDQDYQFNDANNNPTPVSGVSSCISSLTGDESDCYVLNLASAVQNNTQSPCFIEDQENCYDDNNICPTPLDTVSCISSLSADESHYFLNLASAVQNYPPVRTMNSHSHDHLRIDPEMNQVGVEDLDQVGIPPHHRQFNGNISQLQMSPSANWFPVYHDQTISASTTPTIRLIPNHSKIQQHSGYVNSTIINDTSLVSHDHQSKKLMCQLHSIPCLLSTVSKPASIHEGFRSISEPNYKLNARSSPEFSDYNTYHSQKTQRKKRRMRRVVKSVLKAVLIRRKGYDFERSSGSLT